MMNEDNLSNSLSKILESTKCDKSPSLSSDSAVNSPSHDQDHDMEFNDEHMIRKNISPSSSFSSSSIINNNNKRCYMEDHDQSDDGIDMDRVSPPNKQININDSFNNNSDNDDSKIKSENIDANNSNKSLTNNFGYRSELKRPDLKGSFRCTICSKIFCHSSSLSRHRMQAHFKSYTCTICHKEISSKFY
uniref:C2H2-type domain-containing protein n=1 Tax=Parastrongyloides trichosuri TaxID=131310 RepID=A0A0N4ZY63_PARTI